MNQLIHAVAVDNVTINKTALGKLQTIAGAVMQYSDTRYEVVSFTRDTSLADGAQIVALATQKTPKAFTFFMVQDSVLNEKSWGFDTVIAHMCLFDNATTFNFNGSYSILDIHTPGSVDYYGRVTATANGQFTVSWVKNGSPLGTITILALVAF